MKKSWLIGVWLGLLLVLFFPLKVRADANTLSSLDVHVELKENGTGVITEYRQMNMQEGTELYILIPDEEGLEVIDFYVEGMTEVEEWDSDLSREEKAGTYGTSETPDGLELIWGIGEYGENDYTVSYTLTNLVRQLEDGQSLYWNFNSFGDILPEAMSIEISGPFEFESDNSRIWAFGYEGQIEWLDGNVITYTDTPVEEGRPVSVLLQFANNPFLLSYYDEMTLEEQVERAEHEASRGGAGGESDWIFVPIMGAFAASGVAVSALLIRLENKKKEQNKLPSGYQLRKENKSMMYTDIPYKEGEISDVAFFLNQLQMGTFEHYFFAYLLKWAKNRCLIIETDEGKNKKKKTTLTFLPHEFSKKQENIFNHSVFEEHLWNTLLEAADENDQMTNKEMEKWAEKHMEEIQSMEKELVETSKEFLLKEDYMVEKTVKFLGIESPFVAITNKGQRLLDQLTQFENHLISLSKNPSLSYRQLIPEESFLIWAALYGKEEELIKRLEELMPDWAEGDIDFIPPFYMHYYGLHVFSSSMHSGKVSAGYSSSGSGGPTSFGGGGGAMGGGGGGAR